MPTKNNAEPSRDRLLYLVETNSEWKVACRFLNLIIATEFQGLTTEDLPDGILMNRFRDDIHTAVCEFDADHNFEDFITSLRATTLEIKENLEDLVMG